jgi:hypothetical protein
MAVAAAEVRTSRGSYAPLKIKPGYNCVYLSSGNNWSTAYIVNTGFSTKCEGLVDAATLGQPLNVRRIKYGGFKEEDYPPVARWDVRGGEYIISLKCGDAWCEVGSTSVPSAEVNVPGVPLTDAQRAQMRVGRIKGWYDEQVLAIPADGAPTLPGVYVKPSPISARVVPAHDLGKWDECIDFANWKTVGTIEMQYHAHYESKLGLKQGNNRLQLRCKEDQWEAKVIAPGNIEKELAVVRHGHEDENLKVPGTLRWRWLPDDETIWARCLEGCCQVQEDGTGFGSAQPHRKETGKQSRFGSVSTARHRDRR